MNQACLLWLLRSTGAVTKLCVRFMLRPSYLAGCSAAGVVHPLNADAGHVTHSTTTLLALCCLALPGRAMWSPT
jgi:hypothetical protein